MTWMGRPPTVKRLAGDYENGIRTLRKYDITIKPCGR